MSPSNLQGLNIVPSGNSRDLLLSQVYPDLTAQLDLWTNLAFDSDEPLSPRQAEHKNEAKSIAEEEEGEEAQSPINGEKAVHDGHVNVVTPANVPETPSPNHLFAAQSANLFGVDSVLNSLGIDALAAHINQLHSQSTTITPSLAQLLVSRPPYISAFGAGLPQYISDAAAPLLFTPSERPDAPPAKRARTRKASVTSTESPKSRDESLPPNSNLSPVEDKRRRNTAASARFRLKKKEREAALESRAKELETKVKELGRECEDLRRENGWLKGLVVGATGAAQAATSTGPIASSLPPLTTTTTGPNLQSEGSAA